MSTPPILTKPIPNQIVNEGAAYGPFNLNDYIKSESGPLRFQGELLTGEALPKGFICTASGILSGIPSDGTQGVYDILITAENDSDTPLTTQFSLTIKERLAIRDKEFFDHLKSQIWEAVGMDMPIPEFAELYTRPITDVEIYHLLQRYATFTIWDAYNLDAPGEKIELKLEGMSPHYVAYDRGSCIICAPRDLFTYERTLEDGLQSARAVAREVYKRDWVIEFAGFDKLIRAAWVELQLLGEKHGKMLEILHYEPSADDMRIYTARAKSPGLKF